MVMLLAYFLVLFSATSVNAHASEVLQHILKKYDKRVRPNADNHKPVLVQATLVLAILTELREDQQAMSVVISHVQKWVDPKLKWETEKFNGIKQIVMPQHLIWVPKLFVYNSMDTKDMLSNNRYDLRVWNNGLVKINIPQFVTCICRLSIEMFPFDTQFCAVALASPLLNTDEMQVNTSQPPADSYFAGNAEWEVLNVTVRHMSFMEDSEYRAEIHYILHLRRRPVYYITVIVAPTFLISALSILGIFASGGRDGPRAEKVSLGLGSLLALTVLLDIVAGAMPKSNSVPLLGSYIIAEIVLCAVAVAISMGSLALGRSFIQTKQYPSKLLLRFFLIKPHKLQKHPYESSFKYPPYSPLIKSSELSGIFCIMREIYSVQKSFKDKLEKQKFLTSIETQWNALFTRFDYFFLFAFQALNVLILLMFLKNAQLPPLQLPDNFSV